MRNITCDFNNCSCIALYSSKIFLNKEVQSIPQPPPPLQRMHPLRKKKGGLRMISIGKECSHLPCATYRRALVLVRPAGGFSPQIPGTYLNVMEAPTSRVSEVIPPARMLPKENTFPEGDGAKLSVCFLFSTAGPGTRAKALYCMVSSGQIPSRPIRSLSETLPQNGS